MVLDFMGKITEPIAQAAAPLFSLDPIITIFIFSAFLTIAIALVNRFAVNRKIMKEVKVKMTEVKENLSKAQKEGKTEEINKYMSEYMKLNTESMKQQFKSLLISIVFIMIFLPILNLKYSGMEILKMPFPFPLIAFKPFHFYLSQSGGWILWYFLVSLSIGITFKKIIGE